MKLYVVQTKIPPKVTKTHPVVCEITIKSVFYCKIKIWDRDFEILQSENIILTHIYLLNINLKVKTLLFQRLSDTGMISNKRDS